MIERVAAFAAALVLVLAAATPGLAADLIPAASVRFGTDQVEETPDFQRHVLPLMGRLGCNGRACHGSFQGAGGFRLSLFGYDFKLDHEALLKDGSGRVDTEAPEVSKMLAKPTLDIPHKGGKRMAEGSWQYRVFLRWIEGGAKNAADAVHFEKLEVIPSEIAFTHPGEQLQLQVIAHWGDGTREDVTCISRFRSNDESIAEINEDGLVTCKAKGDTNLVAFYDNGVAVTQALLPVSDRVGPNYPAVPAPTKIDQLVLTKLKKLGIIPAETCTDAEFLRRVSIDMTGTLPTTAEVEAFLADSSPEKRAHKIDELLERPTYAAWWTTRLCDITGNNPRYVGSQIGREEIAANWYKWIYQRVKDNTPYDQLIAGIVLASSRLPGQSYEEYAKEESSYYRATDPADYSHRATMPYFWGRRNLNTPDTRALAFSYTFLGVRLECAQCHKHPFDQWTQDDFKQFSAFFAPIGYGIAPSGRVEAQKMREELGLKDKKGNDLQKAQQALVKEGKPILWQEVFINPNGMVARRAGQKQVQPVKGARVVTPKLLGGEEVSLAEKNDPRAPLMEWLRRKDNPYFARAFVNRVWAVYFGSGIINPPDDMNLANPPSNPALLDYLADEFSNRGFDMKWLHREIALSQTYQRGWRTNETNQFDERNFSRSVVRRIPAEVLINAVALATAGSSDLAKATTLVDNRAIGSKASYGGGGRGNYAARVFGRSTRETNCDCNASNDPNLLQSIYLQNDFEVFNAINRKGGWVDERLGVSAKPKLAALITAAQAIVLRSKEIDDLEKQVETLKKSDNADRAEKLAARLQKLRDAQTAAQEKLKTLEANGPAVPPPFVAEDIVREAYERTLGRRPTDPELDLARDYFTQAGDKAQGMRDLLWALLNTKEFVSNH